MLHVRDPRLLAFFGALFEAPGAATTGPDGAMPAWLSRGIEGGTIVRPGSEEAVVELREVADHGGCGGIDRSDEAPLVHKADLWLAGLVLRHPHAWDLIDGAAPCNIPRLMLSVANCGIAKGCWPNDYLVRCLLALLPVTPNDMPLQVSRIVYAASLKQAGRALYGTVAYDPGRIGPIPLGHTRLGHFALLDRRRARIVLAHADRVLSPQFLEQLAPMPFWMEQFGWRGKLNATVAGEGLMQGCFDAGRYEPRRRKGGRMEF